MVNGFVQITGSEVPVAVSLGNNDILAPWQVTVERVGELSKGQKFYGGFATKEEAEDVAKKMNKQAERNQKVLKTPLYKYMVRRKP